MFEDVQNYFGGAIYPSQSAMLNGLVASWLNNAGAAQCFAEEPSNEKMADEVIKGWELDEHMDAQGYDRDDLIEAFADYRAEVAAAAEADDLTAYGEWSATSDLALASAITALRNEFEGGTYEDAGVVVEYDRHDKTNQAYRASVCIGYVDLDNFTRFDGDDAKSLTDASQAPALVASGILGWFDEDWIQAFAA